MTRRGGYCWARSIPACAGEPWATAWWMCPAWVYPRVCGGTRDVAEEVRSKIGLSPRVRGNLCGGGA